MRLLDASGIISTQMGRKKRRKGQTWNGLRKKWTGIMGKEGGKGLHSPTG